HFHGGAVDNSMWHAVQAFFENGGLRAYVAPVDHPRPDDAASLHAWRSALKVLEAIDEISIVAAPGSSRSAATALPVARELISHAEAMRYRIAILDPMPKQSVSEMQAMRGAIDSSHAALYYPWITIFDPVTQREISVPPSGAVAGIYARTDASRGVHKAPANEEVRGAVGLDPLIGDAQQEILDRIGVNCLRFLPGHGYRVWGARTTSSDPEWKYVNVRRYVAYLERSIERGTQWAVFEPNDEVLWKRIANAIADFLVTEWRRGGLLGDKPETAFFVRCDRSTMTQQDLDAGRLVVMIGVAPVRPAEFVIVRIGHWTADRKP
ncbi:MAG TPA: phage tail sheath subtilisin-like domain-containing protein, partial [Thermoanaerobaculia bacterium]